MRFFRWIAFNLDGRRVGQEHPRAKFTDHEVQLALRLAAEGLSLSDISRRMEIPKSTVCRWLSGQSRGQPVIRWVKGGEYGTQKCTGNA